MKCIQCGSTDNVASFDGLCERCGVALADNEHSLMLLTDRIIAELAAAGQFTGDPDTDVVILKRFRGERLAELDRAQGAAGEVDVIPLDDTATQDRRAHRAN